jgi:hypothetical protein
MLIYLWNNRKYETGEFRFPTRERIYRKIIRSLVKGKANPLQALTGPEGFRRLRIPDFKTIGT